MAEENNIKCHWYSHPSIHTSYLISILPYTTRQSNTTIEIHSEIKKSFDDEENLVLTFDVKISLFFLTEELIIQLHIIKPIIFEFSILYEFSEKLDDVAFYILFPAFRLCAHQIVAIFLTEQNEYPKTSNIKLSFIDDNTLKDALLSTFIKPKNIGDN